MKLLALDLAIRTGWATGRGDGKPRSGVLKLPDGTISSVEPAAAMLDWLSDFHAVEGFERVVMEAPLPPAAQTHANTARILLGLAFAVELFCFRRSLPCAEVAVQTWKKAVVGHGFAKKPDVQAWARRMGLPHHDDNEADALAVWHYAISRGVQTGTRAA